MNFSSKQLNQYETVAEVLTAARQEKRVDLEKVEKILKINKKYLLALEKGDYQILPISIYTKNFTRAYAKYLGVNAKKINQLIDRELEIVEQVQKSTTAPKTDWQQNKIIITPKIIRNVLVVVLSLACIIYLGYQVKTIFSPPFLTIINPEPNLITEDNFITVEGQTLPEVKITINNQEILANKKGWFNKTIDLQTGLNIIEIKAQKKHGQPQTVIRQVLVREVEIIEE